MVDAEAGGLPSEWGQFSAADHIRAPSPRVPNPVTSLLTKPSLAPRLATAFQKGQRWLDDLRGVEPVDHRDSLLTLMLIHDLHTAPLDRLSGSERWQHHPAVAELKWCLEERFLRSLGVQVNARTWTLDDDPVAAMRALAAADQVPKIYTWLATDATYDQLTEFLALEGGPDGGFDDLVAICQLGLEGEAKVELARNYWDEMGHGDLAAVHTRLHQQLVSALDLPVIPRSHQGIEALERSVLGSLLATNRALQPEMLGALGLIELQAGPRCRRVVAALDRLSAPRDAFAFYEVHAAVDPRHGKDWLDNVIATLGGSNSSIGQRIVRGAKWRSTVNARFFDALSGHFATEKLPRREHDAEAKAS